MLKTKLSNQTRLCIELVSKASKISSTQFGQISKTEFKKNSTLVTKTDIQIEKLWRAQISKKFPSDNIYGEELGGDISSYADYWALDPLDGTTNFSLGFPVFGHMAAYIRNRQVQSAAISIPAQSQVMYAQRDLGAYLGDKRLSLAKKTKIPKSQTALLDRGDPQKETDYQLVHSIFSTKFRATRKLGCAAYSAFLLAKGGLAAYAVLSIAIQDSAATSLILEETGYNLFDRHGEKYQPQLQTDLIVCHPSHKTILSSAFTKPSKTDIKLQ